MAIRDLPVKYVWVHRGGKTYAQRYHTLPSIVGVEYRPDLSRELEQFVLKCYRETNQFWWQEANFNSEMPARIYPLSAMDDDPKQMVSLIQRVSGAEYCMFPTRLFRDERFLKTTKYLPAFRDFLAGLYTYGTPEEAYDAIYTVGQDLLQRGETMLEAHNRWRAILLTRDSLSNFIGEPWRSPIRYYGLSYSGYRNTFISESSSMYGVYVKLDFGRAARYAREWLPLITEITARQLARQIVKGYEMKQESEPVNWRRNQSIYAMLGDKIHIAQALCIPAVGSRVREVLESLGKPEIVRFYEQTVLPACRSHKQWKPGAGELYERLLSYGDS